MTKILVADALAEDGLGRLRELGEVTVKTGLNEAQLVHIERRLSVCPGIRGTDLHGELRYEYGYEGSYPAFQRHLRLLRPAEVVVRGLVERDAVEDVQARRDDDM